MRNGIGRVGGLLIVVTAALLAYLIAASPRPADATMRTALASSAPLFFSSLSSTLFPRAAVKHFRLTATSFFLPATRRFTSSPNMSVSNISFLEAVQNRRSIYVLKKSSAISDARIQELVSQAIKNVPSSFNSQSTRLVVLLRDQHDKYWDVVTNILKAHVPEDKWDHTKQRMDMFSGAYGTILFYEDPEPVKALQSKFPQYADKFPAWAEHTSAMHQFVLWAALEAEGLGANLQHYNPLPDQKVSEIWDVPMEWSHKAQLVFGDPVDEKRENLTEKNIEVEGKVKVFGAA